MTEGTFPGGPVDQVQAAELAASLLDLDTPKACRVMGEEIDKLRAMAEELAGRLTPFLDELADREEAITYPRAHAVLTGADTSITYATLIRAEELFAVWSGHRALRARCFRLTNVLNAAVGLDEALIDARGIDRELEEERGQ